MCQSKEKVWWIPYGRIWDNIKEVDKILNTYFPVKICKLCNQVWEKPLKYTKDSHVVYHSNFPRYGLEKETCNACKEKRRKKIYASRTKKRT